MAVPYFKPSIQTEDIEAVVACLRSDWLTTGPRAKAFEAAFAGYVGSRYAVALNSCTAALHLALAAIGLKRGDLVLVPTLTFPATVEVVRYFGAVPVLVDSESESLCIDPQALRYTMEGIASERPVAGLKPPYGPVRAVIPVHYGGQMADMDAIRSLAREYDLAVIEDAAHALPASYRSGPSAPWRSVGTTGDITCFSFYANKCVTTGEGGMAVTDNEEWAERIRRKSLHGLSVDTWSRVAAKTPSSWEYEVVTAGFKYNLNDVLAALGVEQLKHADSYWKARCKVAETYLSGLSEVSGIGLPRQLENRKHSWHLFPIRWEDRSGCDRNACIRELTGREIGTSVHWKPVHLHTLYRDRYGFSPGMFPVSEKIWPTLISLPIFPDMTPDQLDEVVAALLAIRRAS